MLLIINQRRKESLPANSKHSAEGSLLLEAKALNATSHNSKKEGEFACKLEAFSRKEPFT